MRYLCLFALALVLAATVPETATAQTAASGSETIDLRRESMAAMWQRLDRLSALITESRADVSATGEQIIVQPEQMSPTEVYALVHGTEPSTDARDISDLLDHVRTLWPSNTNRGWHGATRAEPVIWVLPGVFQRYFDDTINASVSLVEALSSDDGPAAQRSVCELSRTCGRCHSIFRRVTHGDLKVEGNGWTGNYAACRALGN